MYKIGEFSILSKTTIKTLRYYEKEGLLTPSFIDNVTGYRFYETGKLVDLSKIISLRQLGISIENIKNIIANNNSIMILQTRKSEIEKELAIKIDQLSRINYLLEENTMKNEITIKELPDYIVYYKEGIIKDFSHITNFILTSAEECKKDNPNIKCVEPEYCYVSYLDGEYKEKNIKIRYAQAVTTMGVPNETIRFEKLKSVSAASIYHKGSYETIGVSYSTILKWVQENNYEITEPIRERYIDGIWNKDNPADYLTEIQIPIIKK